MQEWMCIRTCFFKDRLWNPGDTYESDNPETIPRHFLNKETGEEGRLKSDSQIQREKEATLEEIMAGNPEKLGKAQGYRRMNKLELLAHAKAIGLRLSDELQREQIISRIVDYKETKVESNQEIANAYKGMMS